MPARRTILIADDDTAIVQALAIRCARIGLHVCTAHDALGALDHIRTSRPDLACLDVNMPAGNGLSVRDMLLSEPEWASIPVIILTGRSDPQTIVRCHETCAYYILKGHDVWSQIEPLIREILFPEGVPVSVS